MAYTGPCLINVKKCSAEGAYNTIRNWLDKCSQVRRLDFSPTYAIKYNIRSAKRNGYLPISLDSYSYPDPTELNL